MSRPINITDSVVLTPVSFDDTNSVHAGVNTSYPIANGYTNSSSTTYSQFNITTGSGATTYIYYNFDTSDIPNGATINSVTCSVKTYINTTNSSRITTRQIQLCTGTTTKGSAGTISNSTNAITITAGSWTLAELRNAKIRMYVVRGTSNTTSGYYVRFYGATLTINYTLSGTAYTVAATSSVSGVTASPASQELLSGNSATVRIDAASIDDIIVTDNGADITSSLVRHTNTAETGSATFIPSSFDSTNSIYNTTAGDSGNGIYSTNYINNGLTNHTSTTRCALYAVQGSGAISKMYYNFDCSSIPANAIINSVSCQVKAGSQGSSYYSSYIVYLCSGTTNKTSSVSVTGSNSSPTTVTVSGGTWSRADLNNIKILFQVTRGSSNTTEDCTWSFFGATLSVTYTMPVDNPYYWTYTISNLAADHAVLVENAGAYIPPEEDPQYTYYSLTLSSINATTNPSSGTTRVVAGTNNTITITPSDPQLTLALDNGVDITNQLQGGTPTNTYTVTTQVSGASYGFNLNSGTGYYVSTNTGRSSSAAVCRVNFNFETACLVTISYINYAEATYDYGIFSNVDSALGTTYSADSNVYKACSASSDNTSSVQTLTYTISAGQHYIDIKYRKDSYTDSNNDTLQWKITSIEATGAGGDYTYTLTNVQANHSLVFVFGNVSYYFVTSSGTGCRLFPDGQQVKLAGDYYIINIVPDDIDDVVVLTDNGIEQTLEEETGVDKYNNPVVSYRYKINAVNAAHTLVVTSAAAATDALYIKLNGTWTQISKVYKKINGSWVEQSLSYLSDNNIQNLRRMS